MKSMWCEKEAEEVAMRGCSSKVKLARSMRSVFMYSYLALNARHLAR